MSSKLLIDATPQQIVTALRSPVRADGSWSATWQEWYDATGYGYNTAVSYIETRRAYHTGLDLVRYDGETAGAPVYAAADGRVCCAGKQRGWSEGDVIVIRHADCYSRYAHVHALVREGDEVRAGDLIAYIADYEPPTDIGAHLHFDVTYDWFDLCAMPNHWAGMSIKLLQSAYADPRSYALED